MQQAIASGPASGSANSNIMAPTSSGKASGKEYEPGALSTNQPTELIVTLGPAETLLGPTWKLDTQFNTVGRVPSVVGYVSNTNAWAYSTSNLQVLNLLPNIALLPGSSGNFDGCGVWLNSTYKDGSIVRGWYHAETHPSNCDASPAHKSVGYAESYDGGLTFVKPSYPNNKVISAPSRYTDPEDASEGDSHVIRVGDYFYMYFVVPRDSYKIHLARSLVTDGGTPGTWWKYYNGTFSQPGIGGESSALASGSVLGRAWVSYNTAVGEYMGFSWSPTGFGLSLSPDGINWREVTGDILSTEHEFHDRNSSSGELIDYMSLIGLDGDPALTGSDVWLYYMRVPAGQPMVGDTRYLVRRALHVGGDDSCPVTSFSDVPVGSTFYPFVHCLACRNIMGGYSNNTFRPGAIISRGQIAKVVSSAAGFNEDPGTQLFEDISPDSTFYPWVNRLALRDIMGGYACGGAGEPCGSGSKPYFRPGANATRGQIAKIISIAAGFNEAVGSRIFEDVPSSSTFYNAIQRLATRDIMGGYACGGVGEPCGSGNKPYFRPALSATRGQIAKVVSNTFFPDCNP